MESWLLHDRGRHLQVDTWPEDDRSHARLLVDGEEVDAGDGGALDTVRLAADDLRVLVRLRWRGRAGAVDLLDHGTDGPPAEGDGFGTGRFGAAKVSFEPPPGTRAARTHAWREAHPRLWAARHVAVEALVIAVTVLGVGALVSAVLGRLLPRIDLDWLPDIDAPGWLRYLDPFHWLGRILPDLDWFGWVPDVDPPGWLKYAVPLLIAVAAGVSEYRKRQQRAEREAADGTAGDGTAGDDPPVSP